MGSNDILSEAKRIANEAAQLAEQIETTESAAGVTQPTNYSSSVSSCEVDTSTGNITLTVVLYPGEQPIVPPPTGEPQPEVPAEVEPAVEPSETEQPPPGHAPAQ